MTITNLTISSCHTDFASGARRPSDVAQEMISVIQQKDEQLGAFLSIDEKDIMRQASEADERYANGTQRSPLDGIPIGLKDNFLHKGQPCRAGSKILDGFVSPYDGGAVRKLKEAGAILTGRMNCDEFAMGSSNENAAYRPCVNPINAEYVPGGSSGGSAAGVAAGMVLGSLGTDTGGSIRLPASFCGLVGLKPTYGRVSRFGVVAFASSLDQVGPFAKTVDDCRLLYNHLQGFDARDTTSRNIDEPVTFSEKETGLKGVRVGVPKSFVEHDGLDDEVRATLMYSLDVLKSLGATIVDVDLPHLKYAVATYYIIATAEAASNLARYDGIRYGQRLGETDGLEGLYRQTRGQLFGDEVKRRILLGNYVLSAGYFDAYYRKAQKVRRLLAHDYAKAFEECDVIFGPTSPTPPFKLGEKAADPLAMYLSDIYTVTVNLAGNCALSLNAGFSKDGLPIGMQLIGGLYQESTILNVAHRFEGAGLGRQQQIKS